MREARQGMRPFLTVAAAWTAVMAASNLATPLYAVYERRFGFAPVVLTLVFATYALVLAPSLLVFGQLSDRLGRRRVIAAGLLTAAAAAVVFAFAAGVGWLFAARAVQGLSVGMISGAASAALVELDPVPRSPRAALFATLAQAGGSAAGPLLAGALAQWAPRPRELCFAISAAVTVTAALAVLRIREPPPAWREEVRGEPPRDVPDRRRLIQRPSVPAPMRTLFVRVGLTGAAVWAVAALFLSVVPSYAGRLLHTSDLALLGAISALMLAASCGAQILARRATAAPRLQAVGLVLAAAGLVALVVAFPLGSLAAVLAAALLTGSGHGFAFLGAQQQLNLAAPPDRRGEVNAAFLTVIYLGVATAVISAGLLTLGTSLQTAVTAFAITIGTSSLILAAWHIQPKGDSPL